MDNRNSAVVDVANRAKEWHDRNRYLNLYFRSDRPRWHQIPGELQRIATGRPTLSLCQLADHAVRLTCALLPIRGHSQLPCRQAGGIVRRRHPFKPYRKAKDQHEDRHHHQCQTEHKAERCEAAIRLRCSPPGQRGQFPPGVASAIAVNWSPTAGTTGNRLGRRPEARASTSPGASVQVTRT